MGMQTAHLIKAWLEVAFHFVMRHSVPFAVGAAILFVFAWFVWSRRPEDLTGNGIAVGEAKAFDNSSLTLRLQRLNASLETLKVFNPSITDNLSALQERTATETSAALSAGPKEKDQKRVGAGEGKDNKNSGLDPKKTPESSDSKSPMGLAAVDAPTNQLNLASQVISVQAVYEGALSDLIIADRSRLQTVLGFQVSISPPAGYADSVAIVEMAVRTAPSISEVIESPSEPAIRTWVRSIISKITSSTASTSTVPAAPSAGGNPATSPSTASAQAVQSSAVAPAGANQQNAAAAAPPSPREKAGPDKPVSLVALMPQEKTFNAEHTTSADRAIDGAGTVQWLKFGLQAKAASRGQYIRRDPETVAFERKPQGKLDLLEDATTFGWEFRPELGRRAVAPGPRQLMAVIAVPKGDDSDANETVLEVKTRSYWRRYNRNKQTTSSAWSWMPWRVDRSATYTSQTQQIKIPNTAKIQSNLAPCVTEVNWTDVGGGKAYVTVSGRNFFPGTRVLIGGQPMSEKDASLTLKSEQTLYFEAPLASLAFGAALLIGRYGEAVRLEDGRKRSIDSLAISSASLRPIRNTKLLLLTVDIFGVA